MAAAQRHGVQRVANLRLLHGYARGFEQSGFRGLSAFVRYLDRMEQQAMDMAPASTVSEGGNVVRILSIHNSKGLEFPVVFLAGLGGLFNPDSTRGELLLHVDAGIGLVRREADTLRQYNTLPRQGVSLVIQSGERAEELRVLYVAMTRAKEKLCLVMSLRQPASLLSRLAASLGDDDKLSAFTVLSARSMSEWLLACALRHPSGKILRDMAGDDAVSIRPAAYPWSVEVCRAPAAGENAVEEIAAVQPDMAVYETLRRRLAYTYPYAALGQVPSKLAASELSHEGVRRQFVAASRPAFLSHSGLSPTERGVALHTFMQFADYSRAAPVADAGDCPPDGGRLPDGRTGRRAPFAENPPLLRQFPVRPHGGVSPLPAGRAFHHPAARQPVQQRAAGTPAARGGGRKPDDPGYCRLCL